MPTIKGLKIRGGKIDKDDLIKLEKVIKSISLPFSATGLKSTKAPFVGMKIKDRSGQEVLHQKVTKQQLLAAKAAGFNNI